MITSTRPDSYAAIPAQCSQSRGRFARTSRTAATTTNRRNEVGRVSRHACNLQRQTRMAEVHRHQRCAVQHLSRSDARKNDLPKAGRTVSIRERVGNRRRRDMDADSRISSPARPARGAPRISRTSLPSASIPSTAANVLDAATWEVLLDAGAYENHASAEHRANNHAVRDIKYPPSMNPRCRYRTVRNRAPRRWPGIRHCTRSKAGDARY